MDALTRERWSFDMERHRYETQLRFMAAELNEYREFVSVLTAEQLPEASRKDTP